VNRREFVVAGAALPFALRSGRALAGGWPLALATADTEAHLVAVDLGTGRVARRIATLPDPRSIAAVGRSAVVAHWTTGVVTVLDAPSLAVRHIVRGFDEPRYAAASRDGRYAFLTDSGRAEVATLDVERGRIVGRVHLGEWPRHLSLDPTGRVLWVALGSQSRRLAVVDVTRPQRPRLAARITPPFLAHGVTFAPDGRHVWVTSGDRGALAIYDARGRHVVAQLPAGAAPQHVTFLDGAAHVTSGNDGTLRVHGLDGRVRRTTPIPVGSFNVQNGWGRVLTASLSRGTVCVLDGRGDVVTRTRVAASSHDACFVMSA
jgi:DNA-binding beta-propeller fold protein YncE